MAVTKVQETWDAREANIEVTGRLSAGRSFRVIVDDARTPWPEVVTGVDPDTSEAIPAVGSPHPENLSLYCSAVRPVQRNKFLWEVNVQYSNEQDRAEEPEDDPIEIEWDSDQFQRPALVDKDGNAIVNSAGDAIDPPPMMDDSRRVVTIRRNATSVPSWILDYQDAVNDSTFMIDGITVAAGCAKVQRVSVGPWQSRNDINFRQVTIVIHLRRDGWRLESPDTGFRYKSGSNRIAIAFDETGALVSPFKPNALTPSSPVQLNSDGTVNTNPTSANINVILTEAYTERDFSPLVS